MKRVIPVHFLKAVLLMPVFLCGCNLLNYDRTAAPGMDRLVGKQFVVANDSFLLDDACVDEFDAKSCLLMQVTGGFVYHLDNTYLTDVPLPKSFKEYSDDETKYRDLYIDTSFFKRTPKKIVGEVKAGSVVTIVQLVSKGFGETGRCWVVYGHLEGFSADTVVQVPACGMNVEARPLWFSYDNYDAYDLPPKPDSQYLIEERHAN